MDEAFDILGCPYQEKMDIYRVSALCMQLGRMEFQGMGEVASPKNLIIIIIITRPKPAYGRQGLAGSWGQDTDKVSNFWVFLTSHFAQLGNKPTWDHS